MKALRLFALLFAALAAFCSCADKESVRADTSQGAKSEIAIAVIRDGELSALTDDEKDASRGARDFCEREGLRYFEITSRDRDDGAITAAIEAAVSQGARAVVCTGYNVARVILGIGDEHPDVSFLCVQIIKPDSALGEYLSPNVHFAIPDFADAGYLAGRVSAEYGSSFAFSAMMRTDSALDCLSGYVQGISEGMDGADVLVSVDAGYGINGDGELMTEVMSDLLYDRGADAVTALGAMIYPCSVSAQSHGARYISIFDMTYDAASRLPSPVFDTASAVTACLGRLYSGGMKWGAKDAGTCTEEGIAEGAITLFGDDGLFDTVKSGVDSGTLKIKRAGTFDEIGADNVKITFITDTEDLYEGS